MSAQGDAPDAARARFSEIARLLDVAPTVEALDGSRSGADVRTVVRSDGTFAILKVMVAADGDRREAAERELTFYREVASRLSLRTPTLLDAHRDQHGVALLLSAHDALVPAQEWSGEHWRALAADLAELHETPFPSGGGWLQPPGPLAAPVRASAQKYWRATDVGDTVASLLADPSALGAAADQHPVCFAHGDCHTENILVEGRSLVWTDWQQAGGGRPAHELAFPSVRATPSGAVLPLADMVTLYAERRGLDPAELQRSVTAAELLIFLFAWPPFAAFIPDAGVQRVHRRIACLVEQWRSDTGRLSRR